MVIVLASSADDRGFNFRSGKTKVKYAGSPAGK